MHIHFADATVPKGQYDLLLKHQIRGGLLSYHYRNCEKHFAQWWDGLVRIHLAGLPSQNKKIQSSEVPMIESHLTTYSDRNEVKSKEDVWMNIHLTDTTGKFNGDRNIKELLADEQQQNHLYSSAYPNQEKDWAIAPKRSQKNMNIHLAGHTADLEMDKDVKSNHLNHLSTYSDKKEIDNTSDRVVDLRPRVLIDSGAFTAFTTGKVIKPQDYAKWALGFKKRWEDKMSFLRFMNLDVIGDQDASWDNQAILEKMGINPIPIVTYGADLKHLHRAINNYDYIALGGLVPYTRQKKKLESWLNRCFKIIVAKYKKTGVMPKVHLLGVTTDWVLKRYPCYSSDSSSWVSCLRFGGGTAAGIKQLPRYKKSDAALAATVHTLRAEIKKYQKMETEATNLWTQRGVLFD